ncbi:MAG: hypothetical protein G01um101466_112 [Parcubacteria group bacterium Gr01-1014_66]|nr:MAG: hypothetical protein G01um101466_112 [Parcubacteria group bacterium Gr01-1014_66]
MFFAPTAVFLILEFALYFTDVFAAPVIIPLTDCALKADENWLRHKGIECKLIFAGELLHHHFFVSQRWESDPRPFPYHGNVLPLNYSGGRKAVLSQLK